MGYSEICQSKVQQGATVCSCTEQKWNQRSCFNDFLFVEIGQITFWDYLFIICFHIKNNTSDKTFHLWQNFHRREPLLSFDRKLHFRVTIFKFWFGKVSWKKKSRRGFISYHHHAALKFYFINSWVSASLELYSEHRMALAFWLFQQSLSLR